MESWSPERAAALASDAASLAAAQPLANARKWSALGRGERAIWGLCQGSGKQPYQTRVDLTEPAFKCSCPSRKFPCKHSLGLLLLFANDAAGFASADEPPWVADWLGERAQRTAKKAAQGPGASDKPFDLEAQARRAAQREARVRDGVAGCRVWLEDLVRRGLAAAQRDPDGDWERAAARLVDAQAPGLASYVRRIPMTMASGPGWEVRTVDLLGRLHLLLSAAERVEQLPQDLAVDVRTALGFTQSQDEALASIPVADRWMAVAQVIEEDERFRSSRTWLVGQKTGRRALVLEFAAGERPLERSVTAGATFDGELVFYPGRQPLRALITSRSQGAPAFAIEDVSDRTIAAGLTRYAQALASNPWIVRWPLVLTNVRIAVHEAWWCLIDAEDRALPMRQSFASSIRLWQLVSASAGRPLTVIVEWDGLAALPISSFGQAAEYLDLAPGWAA